MGLCRAGYAPLASALGSLPILRSGTMLDRMRAGFFGCPHRNCTFPITLRSPHAGKRTYVVCLDCGEELAYDWERMELKAKRPQGTPSGALTNLKKAA